MKKYFIHFIFFCLAGNGLYSQVYNDVFYRPFLGDSTDLKHSLSIGIYLNGFMRNNEYFNEIAEGYTLFGYQFNPCLVYRPAEKIQLYGGIFLLKDFGENAFSQVAPYLKVKFSTGPFSILFGNIEGTASHQLIEPLYDFERLISNYLEEGIQFRWMQKSFFFDTWIDWENHITYGDPDQEKFNAGLSARLPFLNRQKINVLFPVQFIASHQGGQINNSSEPVFTTLNTALGVIANWNFPEISFLHSIEGSTYYTFYRGPHDVPDPPLSEGEGWLINLLLNMKIIDVYVSYWNGFRYYSPVGGPLYQSVPANFPENNKILPDRQLIIGRIIFEKRISGGLDMSFRFEPVFDLNSSRIDHSESLFLVLNIEEVLTHRKK